MSNWTFRILSLGGRLILLNSILGVLPIYWLSLMKIPTSILHRIISLMFNFLWAGSFEKKSIHLENWKLLSHPFANSGWNIEDLKFFNEVLMLKNLWNVLMGNGLWSCVIKEKYLNHLSVTDWLRLGVY